MFFGGHLGKSAVLLSANLSREGKDQESMQSSTTPDPEQHSGKWQKHKKTTHTWAKRLALFQAGDHKAARNIQDNITKTIMKHK